MSEFDSELAVFLRTKRQLLHPEAAALSSDSAAEFDARQRAEIAGAAGISPAYYSRLEHGEIQRASRRTLRALAHTLQLSPEETKRLEKLAAAGRPAVRRGVSSSILTLLESWPLTPAYVCNARLNMLASNRLAQALSPMFMPGENALRSLYLDPRVYGSLRNWNQIAASAVAGVHHESCRGVHDSSLIRLIGEISIRSPEFSAAWAKPGELPASQGQLLIDHPRVGEIDLTYHRFELISNPGQCLVVFHADPGSHSANSLQRLAHLSHGAH